MNLYERKSRLFYEYTRGHNPPFPMPADCKLRNANQYSRTYIFDDDSELVMYHNGSIAWRPFRSGCLLAVRDLWS